MCRKHPIFFTNPWIYSPPFFTGRILLLIFNPVSIHEKVLSIRCEAIPRNLLPLQFEIERNFVRKIWSKEKWKQPRKKKFLVSWVIRSNNVAVCYSQWRILNCAIHQDRGNFLFATIKSPPSSFPWSHAASIRTVRFLRSVQSNQRVCGRKLNT